MSDLPMGNSKIDRYGLGDQVLQLVREKKNVREIAEILSDQLASEGESISHEAVSKWIRKRREEQDELRKAAASEVLRDRFESDVKVLEHLADRLLEDFDRDFQEVKEDMGMFGILRKQVPLPYEMRVQLAGEIRQVLVAKQKIGTDNAGAGDFSLGALLHGLPDDREEGAGDG